MAKIDYDVGDRVICIQGFNELNGTLLEFILPRIRPEVGEIYTVHSIQGCTVPGHDHLNVGLEEFGTGYLWPAERFRKVPELKKKAQGVTKIRKPERTDA